MLLSSASLEGVESAGSGLLRPWSSDVFYRWSDDTAPLTPTPGEWTYLTPGFLDVDSSAGDHSFCTWTGSNYSFNESGLFELSYYVWITAAEGALIVSSGGGIAQPGEPEFQNRWGLHPVGDLGDWSEQRISLRVLEEGTTWDGPRVKCEDACQIEYGEVLVWRRG